MGKVKVALFLGSWIPMAGGSSNKKCLTKANDLVGLSILLLFEFLLSESLDGEASHLGPKGGKRDGHLEKM